MLLLLLLRLVALGMMLYRVVDDARRPMEVMWGSLLLRVMGMMLH